MLSPKTALLTALTATLLLASGCGVDRFNDVGCVSDQECRLGRTCSEGICVDPNGVDQPVEPDVGPDADADVDDPEPDVGPDPEPDTGSDFNVEPFLGDWDLMMVEGTLTQPDGSQEPIEPQRSRITIQRGRETDLLIKPVGAADCPYPANLTSETTFELQEHDCLVGQGNTATYYLNIEGEGSRIGTTDLDFRIAADLAPGNTDQPEPQARFEMHFEGTKR